jgi:hypothetical protein
VAAVSRSPRGERDFFEPRLGHDLARVRVHAGPRAAAAAHGVAAAAFTVGSDLFFGGGRWAPGTEAGRRLLAHELTHVVQQSTTVDAPVLRRAPDPTAPDPEKVLGERLLRDFPDGINVAFFQSGNDEAERRAAEWATRENALGVKGNTLKADKLEFGRAFGDDKFDVKTTLPKLAPLLTAAVSKARPAGATVPPAGSGPDRVRTLGLFAHGITSWCGVGSSGLTVSNAKALVTAIEPTITRDVRVLLYACSNARGQSETESWTAGTMKGGGADSLAGVLRDELVEAGVNKGSVWGHTTVGHVTDNFALRVFYGADGKGSAGVAFAGERVFGAADRSNALNDLKNDLGAQGYDPVELATAKFEAAARARIESAMYSAYADANAKLTYNGGKLAMMAPMYPAAVEALIHTHWRDVFWPGKRPDLGQALVKSLKLKKLPATPAKPSGPETK